MKILLIGYGKMGQAIEQIAQQRGHYIIKRITSSKATSLQTIDAKTIDVALEFTQPQAAYNNIYQCLTKNIPIISGTTGWLAKKKDLDTYCITQKGTFFYAANFSIGMNLFFKVNQYLAKRMHHHPEFNVTLEEIHHQAKKDLPSGTAITLAEDILQSVHRKKKWQLAPVQQAATLSITAKREKNIPGTHTVTYNTPLETLTLQHTAHSRVAFAQGAILVAEWIQDKQGVLGMEDFLKSVDCIN